MKISTYCIFWWSILVTFFISWCMRWSWGAVIEWADSQVEYTAPTVEQFYEDIDMLRSTTDITWYQSLSPVRREELLLMTLSAHEDHLSWLTSPDIKNDAYMMVVQELIQHTTSWSSLHLWTWATENTSTLSSTQQDQLVYLIQEEKLARDVYMMMHQKRWIKKFYNILNAEENHQAQVAGLLSTYWITNPTTDADMGVFSDVALQELYTMLITQWSISADEAIKVGIAIEEKDIKDIQDMMDNFAQYPHIQAVLTKLLNGSKNHLAAFEK